MLSIIERFNSYGRQDEESCFLCSQQGACILGENYGWMLEAISVAWFESSCCHSGICVRANRMGSGWK